MANRIGPLEAVLAEDKNRVLYGMTPGTWWKVIQHFGPDDRNAIGPVLSRVYSGLDPSTDHSTAIYLDLRKFNVELRAIFRDALRKENIMVEAVEFDVGEVDEAIEETSAPAKKSRSRKRKNTGVIIPEGYGDTERGTWFPGYDAKWKSVLITRVDKEQDEEAAAEMVSRNWWTQETADARLAKARAPKGTTTAAAETDDEDDELDFEEVDDTDDE